MSTPPAPTFSVEPIAARPGTSDGYRRRIYADGQRPIEMCADLGYRAFNILGLPGGRTLVAGDSSGKITLHHPSDGRLEGVMSGHTGAVLTMTVASDSIFTGGQDKTIRQWSLVDFGLVREMLGHTGSVLVLASAPSTRHCGLFSAGDDDEIYQWQWDNGELVWSFKGHESPINCLAATNTLLFAGCSEGKIYVHSLGLKRRLLSIVDGRCDGSLLAMCCSNDGTALLTAGHNGLIRLWSHSGEESTAPCELVSTFPKISPVSGDGSVAPGTANGSGGPKAPAPGPEASSASSTADSVEPYGAASNGKKYAWSHNATVRALALQDTTVFAATSEGSIIVYDVGEAKYPMYMETLTAHFEVAKQTASPDDDNDRVNGSTEFDHGRRDDSATYTATRPFGKSEMDSPAAMRTAPSIEASPSGGGMRGTASGSDADPLRSDVADLVETEQRSLTDRINAITLQNNELYAVGFDGYLVKWPIVDLLTEAQAMIPLPPLYMLDQDDSQSQHTANPAKLHEKMLLLDAGKAAIRYKHLPINYLITALRDKVTGAWLRNEALAYVPFVIMFLFFVAAEIDIYEVYLMNRGVAGILETQSIGSFKQNRAYPDITAATWWGRFTTQVLVPQLWSQRRAEVDKGTALQVAGQNEVIGSVRFRTQRAHDQSCSDSSKLYPTRFTDFRNPNYSYSFARAHANITQQCYGNFGELTNAKHSKVPFACEYTSTGCQYKPADMVTFLNQSNAMFNYDATAGYALRASQFYSSGGHVVEIPTYLSMNDALKRASVIYQNGFVDDVATRIVIIEFFHYSAPNNIFINHKYICEVFAGGTWFPRVTHVPFKVFTFEGNTFRVVYEIVFFLFVLWWIYVYFANMYRHKQTFGGVLGYIFDVWTLLDIVNCLFFIATFYFRWQWYALSLSNKVQRPFQTQTFPDKLAPIEDAYSYTVYVNSVNTVLTLLKVMKYAQLSDKLNLLTRALSKAQAAIIGVLFLFVYFVFAFALAGNAIYGENVFVFRSLDAAYNTLLRWLVGDVDYESLSDVTRLATPVFVWSFRIVAQFILLSLLIAVLADAFDEAVADRLPIPLDAAIVRVAGDMRKFFLPQYLRVTFLLLLRRSSRTAVIAKQLKMFLDYRDSILSAEALIQQDFDELDDHYISKTFFNTDMAPDDVKKQRERKKSTALGASSEQPLANTDAAPDADEPTDDLNFLDEVWYDLAYEYHWKLQDAFHRKQHALTALVEDVVTAQLTAMKRHLTKYDKAARDLSRLVKGLKAVTNTGGGGVGQSFDVTASTDSLLRARNRGSMMAMNATAMRPSPNRQRARGTASAARDLTNDDSSGSYDANSRTPESKPVKSSLLDDVLHSVTTATENLAAMLTEDASAVPDKQQP